MHGSDEFETGAVTNVSQAGVEVATEVTLLDLAFLGAVKERAPIFQLVDSIGRLLGVQLSHAPVVQHLAAAHGVAEVDLPVVLFVDVAHGSRHAALSHHRVGFTEEGFADQCDLEAAVLGFDGGTKASATGTNDNDVVIVMFSSAHVSLPKKA